MRLNDIIIESVKSSYDQGGKSWYELQDAKALAKKDGKNPDRLSYGELSSYIEKARKSRKDEDKQRLDPKCWKGYKKQGTKMKGGVRVNNCVKEAKQALARHVKEGVPLPDSLFRYQSEAYFDTFKYAKQLREAGILQELDWESEEMLSTDIGESVVLENGETVWLDVPYLDENDFEENYDPKLITMLDRFEKDSAEFFNYYGDTDVVSIAELLKQGREEDAAEEMAGAMADQDGGSDKFDQIYDLALDHVENYTLEPAMAEMRKLAGIEERSYKDVGVADVVKDRRGKEFKFDKDSKQFKSMDGEVADISTKLGKDLLRLRRNAMKRTSPSYKKAVGEAEYQGKDVELNKPKRGGSKKYYVYVKNPKTGNVKKISFGDPGLKTKSGNKGRAKSFAARHNCEKKNDKTKAGYWACRLPRYGLVKGGKWW
jgi:hypothetical protein